MPRAWRPKITYSIYAQPIFFGFSRWLATNLLTGSQTLLPLSKMFRKKNMANYVHRLVLAAVPRNVLEERTVAM